MSISKILEKGIKGAGVGGTFGGIICGALATIGGTALFIATAPVSLPAAVAITTISAAGGTAYGTLIGGGAGIVSGTIDEIKGK
ncbi:hypothetical protein [Clostridium butyricum]|uniref:hypothetical protein n=1 Tax=Clostridium butyricum TaxID=1492 RepID=UPI00374E62AB